MVYRTGLYAYLLLVLLLGLLLACLSRHILDVDQIVLCSFINLNLSSKITILLMSDECID